MRIGSNNKQPLRLDNKIIDRVDHFTYLGSNVDKNGGTEVDVEARIQKARGALNAIWNSCNLTTRTKI